MGSYDATENHEVSGRRWGEHMSTARSDKSVLGVMKRARRARQATAPAAHRSTNPKQHKNRLEYIDDSAATSYQLLFWACQAKEV